MVVVVVGNLVTSGLFTSKETAAWWGMNVAVLQIFNVVGLHVGNVAVLL